MSVLSVFTRNAVVLYLIATLGGAIGQCESIQLWPEIDLSLNAKRTNFLIPLLWRFQSGQPNPQFAATGVIGTFSLNRRWGLSAGYLFADLPQQNATAHVPLVALTGTWATHHWTFAESNRFERLLNFTNQPYRYRNRAIADYAFGRTRARHLYCSNEFFINLSDRSWNQNRAMVGVGIPIRQFTRVDAYFLHRTAPRGRETSVIGTVLTIEFGKRS